MLNRVDRTVPLRSMVFKPRAIVTVAVRPMAPKMPIAGMPSGTTNHSQSLAMHQPRTTISRATYSRPRRPRVLNPRAFKTSSGTFDADVAVFMFTDSCGVSDGGDGVAP